MKFLVIVLKDVTVGDVFGPGDLSCEGVEESPDAVHHTDVSQVIPCEDTREVCKAILTAAQTDQGWSVWECTPKGIVQRAVVFKRDGSTPYDVEVS